MILRNINKISDEINLNLSDSNKKLLVNRINILDKIFYILIREILENKVYKNNKPFIKNLRKQILDETTVNLSNKEIYILIKELSNNSKNQKGGGINLGALGIKNRTMQAASILINALTFIKDFTAYGLTANIILSLINKNWFTASFSLIKLFPNL